MTVIRDFCNCLNYKCNTNIQEDIMIRKSSRGLVMLAVLSLVTTGFAADKYQWKLAGTENDCQLYTSEVPGKGYIAAKSSCVIPARIGIVGEVLRDIANYPKWMEGCVETKILKAYDPENDGYIFWYHQGIPLMTDRDMVLKCSVNMDTLNARNTINTELTGEIPYDAGKGYVRMPSFSSVWTLEYVDREHTRVTFMIDPDLGVGIPKYVANPIIKSMPYKSLKKMKEMVKGPAYVKKGETSRYNKLAKDPIKSGSTK